jgi:hypothetical protein
MNEYKIDKILSCMKKKIFFNSQILTNEDQRKIYNKIDRIYIYKGRTKISDICFIKVK